MMLAARQVLKVIYKKDVHYAKAGIMLFDLCQHNEVQLDLFADKEANDSTEDTTSQTSIAVSVLMDKMNKRYGKNSHQQAAVFIASEGIKDKQTWQMSREMLSPCYTTDIHQLPKVH